MKAPVMLACALLGLGACASQPGPAEVADAANKAGETGETAKKPENCLRETGTKIKRRADNRCVDAAGKVITAEDIERSGAQTVDEVLRNLPGR